MQSILLFCDAGLHWADNPQCTVTVTLDLDLKGRQFDVVADKVRLTSRNIKFTLAQLIQRPALYRRKFIRETVLVFKLPKVRHV